MPFETHLSTEILVVFKVPDLIKKEDSWKVYGSHPEEAQTIPLTSDCLELSYMTSPEAKESGKHILACRTLVLSMEEGKMDFSR